jgi:hypothetical protein
MIEGADLDLATEREGIRSTMHNVEAAQAPAGAATDGSELDFLLLQLIIDIFVRGDMALWDGIS